MASEELPQWLVAIGRSPKVRQIGRPVPPISGSIRAEKEVNKDKAALLERDLLSAIDDSTLDQEHDLHCRVLDYMTGNRLSSDQAFRLLSRLWAKNGDSSPGLSRVDRDGNLEQMPWGTV